MTIRPRNLDELDQSSLDKLKRSFLEIAEKSKDDYDPQDLEKLKQDDWIVYRFLAASLGNQDEALKTLNESMKWRKCQGFRDFKMNFFPDIFFKSGALFQYEADKLGRPSLILRIKFVRKIKEIRDSIESFVDHLLWQIDEAADGNGWILVLDFKDAGLQNADFELLHHLINSLKVHFPVGVEYVLVVDLPWILKAFWSMVRTWIPNDRSDLVKFTSRKKLGEYFDENNLPDFLGGKCNRPYKGDKMVPIGAPDVHHFGTKVVNISEDRIESLIKIYESIIAEN